MTKFRYKLFTDEIYVCNSATFKRFLVNKIVAKMYVPKDAKFIIAKY